MGRHRHARTLCTNAKPCDEYAGLYKFATSRGFISSLTVTHRLQTRALGWLTDRFDLFSGFTPRLNLPAGIKAARLAPRSLSSAAVSRLGITLEHSVEGGRRQFASGTPPTGRAQQRTPRQQPDQGLVRESTPTRVTVAASVDAFLWTTSRRIGTLI